MPPLDTNVLLRWLVDDDHAHAPVVRGLRESAIRTQGGRCSSRSLITVPLELEWVLRARYGCSLIDSTLAALLEARRLSIPSDGCVECALQLVRQ